MLVAAHLRLVGLELLQPGEQRRPRGHLQAQRHRVDEEADHRLNPGELSRAAGNRDAEHNVGTAAVAAEQHPPRPLYHGVQRKAVAASELAQAARDWRRERERLCQGRTCSVEHPRPTAGEERRELLESVHRPAPPGLVSRRVAAAEPCDEVAKRRRLRQRRLLTRDQRAVASSQLLEHQEQTPTVEQHMVVRPHQAALAVGAVEEGQAHQRRFGEVDAATPVLSEEGVEPGGALRWIVPLRAAILDGDADPPMHQLQRPLQSPPLRATAQRGMVVDHQPPALLHDLGVDVRSQSEAVLGDVLTAAGRVEAVEEHPRLHRREGVDVVDVAVSQGVDPALPGRDRPGGNRRG